MKRLLSILFLTAVVLSFAATADSSWLDPANSCMDKNQSFNPDEVDLSLRFSSVVSMSSDETAVHTRSLGTDVKKVISTSLGHTDLINADGRGRQSYDSVFSLEKNVNNTLMSSATSASFTHAVGGETSGLIGCSEGTNATTGFCEKVSTGNSFAGNGVLESVSNMSVENKVPGVPYTVNALTSFEGWRSTVFSTIDVKANDTVTGLPNNVQFSERNSAVKNGTLQYAFLYNMKHGKAVL